MSPTPELSAEDVAAATEASEAARMRTWTEVLAERRAAAAQPQPTVGPPVAGEASAVAPAAPAASSADVEAMVNDAVAKGLEQLAETLAAKLAPPPVVEQGPAGAPGGPEGAQTGS